MKLPTRRHHTEKTQNKKPVDLENRL